jgi:autotransporter-associated beta strand protein
MLQFALAPTTGSASNGKLAVGGVFTGGLSTATGVSIVPNTSLAAGRYTLVTADLLTLNAGFSLDPFYLGDTSQNTRYGFALASDTTHLYLDVTGSNANLTWTGATTADWDVKTTSNWSGDGLFYQSDAVTFGDGPTATDVNITAAVRPASITVSAAGNYTLSGTGYITGGAGITKTGAGTLTIATTGGNDFTGDVAVNGGTLKVGNAASLGSSAYGKTVVNGGTDGTGGTLDGNAQDVNERVEFSGVGFNSAGAIVNTGTANSRFYYATMTGDATVGGTRLFNFGGSGVGDGIETPYFHGNGHALTKTGANEVDFFNVGDTGLGDINITAGGLWPGGNTILGSTGTINVSNNAAFGVFYTAPGVVYAKPIVFAASGGNIYAEPFGGPNTTGIVEISGNITLNGPASVQCITTTANPQTLILSGIISGGSGNSLTVGSTAYAGTVKLTNSNTYQGPTLITAGTLELTASGQISALSAITNSANLQIDAGTHSLGAISGTGTMSVLTTSSVTATSIAQSTLTIGAPPGGAAAVPEPSTWVLLVIGGLFAAFLRKKTK